MNPLTRKEKLNVIIPALILAIGFAVIGLLPFVANYEERTEVSCEQEVIRLEKQVKKMESEIKKLNKDLEQKQIDASEYEKYDSRSKSSSRRSNSLTRDLSRRVTTGRP